MIKEKFKVHGPCGQIGGLMTGAFCLAGEGASEKGPLSNYQSSESVKIARFPRQWMVIGTERLPVVS